MSVNILEGDRIKSIAEFFLDLENLKKICMHDYFNLFSFYNYLERKITLS